MRGCLDGLVDQTLAARPNHVIKMVPQESWRIYGVQPQQLGVTLNLTLATNYASRVVVFLLAELGNLVEFLGASLKILSGDKALESLGVNNRKAGEVAAGPGAGIRAGAGQPRDRWELGAAKRDLGNLERRHPREGGRSDQEALGDGH